MRTNRRIAHQIRMKDRNDFVCYYCGMPAPTKDHVIPLSMWKVFESIGYEPPEDRVLLVPSCTECNIILNASYQETLEQRKAYLKELLKKRYAKLLKMPDWEEWELEEMGHELKDTILRSLEERDKVARRIAW